MISTYPACFFKEEQGYTVIFPDLNWLATCGDTLEEAFAMAVDCLAGFIYEARICGDVVAEASGVDKINILEVAEELEISTEGAFVNMVTVDVDEYAKLHFEKSVKKTLTIPTWLNKKAVEQNVNFSQILQEGLKRKLFGDKQV